jgi:hypothetical protein
MALESNFTTEALRYTEQEKEEKLNLLWSVVTDIGHLVILPNDRVLA